MSTLPNPIPNRRRLSELPTPNGGHTVAAPDQKATRDSEILGHRSNRCFHRLRGRRKTRTRGRKATVDLSLATLRGWSIVQESKHPLRWFVPDVFRGFGFCRRCTTPEVVGASLPAPRVPLSRLPSRPPPRFCSFVLLGTPAAAAARCDCCCLSMSPVSRSRTGGRPLIPQAGGPIPGALRQCPPRRPLVASRQQRQQLLCVPRTLHDCHWVCSP